LILIAFNAAQAIATDQLLHRLHFGGHAAENLLGIGVIQGEDTIGQINCWTGHPKWFLSSWPNSM